VVGQLDGDELGSDVGASDKGLANTPTVPPQFPVFTKQPNVIVYGAHPVPSSEIKDTELHRSHVSSLYHDFPVPFTVIVVSP
jgi:hypothetical protein